MFPDYHDGLLVVQVIEHDFKLQRFRPERPPEVCRVSGLDHSFRQWRFSGEGDEARVAAAACQPVLPGRSPQAEVAAVHPGQPALAEERWAARPGPARGHHLRPSRRHGGRESTSRRAREIKQ